MKNKIKSCAGMVLLTLVSLFTALESQAQVTSPTLIPIANFPSVLTSGATSTTTNTIALTKKCGMALQGTFNVSAGSSNVVVQGSFTVDGTNYSTVQNQGAWTWIINANGATKVTASTNWTPLQLAGYSGINITTITNQNSGTLTNFGFTASRFSEIAY